MRKILIDGGWRDSQNAGDFFLATNPVTKSPLPERYPVSSAEDVDDAIAAGVLAVESLRSSTPEQIADFLYGFSEEILAVGDSLVEMAHLETGLPAEPRLLSVELPRTINQLHQAADAARDRSWCLATIDTQTNIRSKYGGLGGPVIVFGPNNFPFAFNSAAGGDFAAAIAAGNPVIAKANTGHPGTTRIFAEAALRALEGSQLPEQMVQMLYRVPPDLGLQLVSHTNVGATGFTGSRISGLRLKAAADQAGKPIYLEMSSINPVFILPGAVEERLKAIAQEYFDSCALGAGQFCTKPGLVVLLDQPLARELVSVTSDLFRSGTPGVLLSERGPGEIKQAIDRYMVNGAELVTGGKQGTASYFCHANTLLSVSGRKFLENPDVFQTEAFGTVGLFVLAEDLGELGTIAASLEGSLTGTFYTHTAGEDDAIYEEIAPIVRTKVGRLLNDKMPTGVAVVPSMNHGGPFPATGHPGFTAVGLPASLRRFGALHCFDSVSNSRLPSEIQDKNPTGEMWRYIDLRWTAEDI